MDERDKCGCHKTCTILPHECDNPCNWPSCLIEEEQSQLADEVMEMLTNE